MTRSPGLARPSLADRGLASLLVLLCASLVVGATGASLWLRSTADDLARATFGDATYAATQVKVTYVEVGDRELPAGGPEAVAAALPPAVRATVDPEPRASVASPEMVPTVLPARPAVPSFLTVAGLPGLESLVEVVDGRLPDPGVTTVSVADLPAPAQEAYLAKIGVDRGDGLPLPDVEVVEVVLEETAASEMNVEIGDLVALSGLSFGRGVRPPAVLRVVGTYEAADAFPTPLDDADTAREPAIDPTPDARTVRATAVAADPTTVLRATWEARPDLRYTFDPATSTSLTDTDQLVAQAREVELQSWPPLARSLDETAVTGLGDLAEQVVSQRATSEGMSLLGLTSLAAGGFAVLLAAAVVLAGRRRTTTRVVRARGAGVRWLLGQRAGEALLLTLPGIAVAAGVVVLAGGEAGDLVVGLVTAGLCVALVALAQLGSSDREQSVVQLVIRDAVQLVLVVLAVASVWLVWRRGDLDVSDPVTLVTAPLVGAAASVVALRLLQLLLGVLRRIATRGRSLAPVVGLSQGLALSQQVVVATSAVVLALTAAGVSVALGDSLRAAAERTGWEQVGADVVAQAPGLEDDTAEALAGLAGVEATAPVFSAPSVSLSTDLGVEGVRLVAFDPDAMREVGADGPFRVDLPARTGEAMPILVSPDLEVADPATELRYATSLLPVEVAGRVDRIPGVTAPGESFVAIDAAALSEAAGRNLTSYDDILIKGSPDVTEVERIVRDRSALGQVRVRSEVEEAQLSSPVVTRTTAVLLAVAVGSALVAGFAVVLLVTLGGPLRRRTGTLLVTLGGDLRQARRVSVLGVAPLVAVACLTSLACGGLMVLVADRGLDLAGLTATQDAVRVLPSGLSVVLAAALCVGLVVLAGLVAVRRPHEPLERTERR
ncbi:hypothetical protein GCM10009623_14130 [Nocardioides aestuarii]|uniref:FtsX-like permease family protein n=1 Tax=Nocardioides aestuarii TaxID=252231 RepID=A0ABW4TLY5_9ACTN